MKRKTTLALALSLGLIGTTVPFVVNDNNITTLNAKDNKNNQLDKPEWYISSYELDHRNDVYMILDVLNPNTTRLKESKVTVGFIEADDGDFDSYTSNRDTVGDPPIRTDSVDYDEFIEEYEKDDKYSDMAIEIEYEYYRRTTGSSTKKKTEILIMDEDEFRGIFDPNPDPDPDPDPDPIKPPLYSFTNIEIEDTSSINNDGSITVDFNLTYDDETTVLVTTATLTNLEGTVNQTYRDESVQGTEITFEMNQLPEGTYTIDFETRAQVKMIFLQLID